MSGNFELGQRYAAPLLDVLFGKPARRLRYDERRDFLPEHGVVHTDHGRLDDTRVLGEPILDFDWIDVLSTPDDQILPTTLEIEEPAPHEAEVSGVVPAFVVERLRRCLTIVPIRGERRGAPEGDVAQLRRRGGSSG